MSEHHPISDLMTETMSKIKEMVDVNTIIGNPIEAAAGTPSRSPRRRSAAAQAAASSHPSTRQAGLRSRSAAAAAPV